MTKKKTESRRASEEKFGKQVVDIGFTIIPSLLVQAQARLGINPVQFNIIIHLLDFWWGAEKKPFPAKKLIAERMGKSERQIQRQIAELEQAKLVRRIARTKPNQGRTSNEYDLTGLVERLNKLAPEFAEAKRKKREISMNVAKPEHKRSR